MLHKFTQDESNKGIRRSVKTRLKNAEINSENKLIATLQQKEIDRANDIYRKGKKIELLNNLPENQKKKYTVQKGPVNENIKLVLQKIFNVSIKDKDKNGELLDYSN